MTVSRKASQTGIDPQSGVVFKFLLQLIALPGILLNGLPSIPAKQIADKKVKLKEFKDSVLVGGSMIFLFVYLMIIIITLSIINAKLILPVLATMVLTCWISRWCYDVWTNNK